MAPQIPQMELDEDPGYDHAISEDDQLASTTAAATATAANENENSSKSNDNDNEPSYATSTAALCICMLAHSYLLISVFPYSGFMAIDLIDTVNEENAGSYAGFIASAFMIGRAVTSFGWGKAADSYGRTSVLCTSLGFSCFCSILFGLSPSFPAALAFRFCLGLVNGIVGTIKTVISELADGDERLEARGMNIVMGMWGWGFLISPAIAGALAEPIRQYPDVAWLQNGVLGSILSKHPFLLPNLLGAALCLIGMTAVSLFVKETLPAEKQRSVSSSLIFSVDQTCCKYLPGYRYQGFSTLKTHESDIELQDQSIGEENIADETPFPEGEEITMASLWARKKTRTCLSIYWAYSFVGLTVDEAFPLFAISLVAGFGISEGEIGKIMSMCGLIFAISQYGAYVVIYNRFGLYGSIRVGSSLSAPIMLLIPISLLLNKGADTGELRSSTFCFLALTLAMYRVFSLVFFGSISVAVNRSVPASERATMNGLSVLGGSIAQGLGPIFSGFLVTSSVAWFGKYGSLMIFTSIGLLGCGVMTCAFIFLRDEDDTPVEDENGSDFKDDLGVQKIELVKKREPKL
jgi:MFS family permease